MQANLNFRDSVLGNMFLVSDDDLQLHFITHSPCGSKTLSFVGLGHFDLCVCVYIYIYIYVYMYICI